MRHYFGANSLSVTTPPPGGPVATSPSPFAPATAPAPATLPDWPLSLVTADASGKVVVLVKSLDPSLYNKPDTLIVAFVPGTIVPTDVNVVQATPGVQAVTQPFPSFGLPALDQSIPFIVPNLAPSTTYVVVVIGQFST